MTKVFLACSCNVIIYIYVLLFILQVEQSTLEFESHLIKIFRDSNENEIGLQTLVNVARSFNDIASETIMSDVGLVSIGFMIVFFYVFLVLGKFDWIENRVSTYMFVCRT